MGYSIVLGGMLSYGFAVGGFAIGTSVPPSGPVLYAVDPRGGSILSPDTDLMAVAPRQGSIIN